MQWCRKVGVAFFILTVLISFGSPFFTRIAQTKFVQPVTAASPVIPLLGEMSFKVYPDQSIKAKVAGSFEQVSEGEPPPIHGMSYNMTLNSLGTNLTKVKFNTIIKLNPIPSMPLSTLDLDITAQIEDMKGNITIFFNLPSYMELTGSIVGSLNKITNETTLSFDLKTTIKYTVIPEESIQELIQNFPTMKTQLTNQINGMTEGNITLQELNFVINKLDTTSATITLNGRITGDFKKGLIALLSNTNPSIEFSPTALDLMTYVSIKDINLHVAFHKEELAIIIDTESVNEGDIDQQFNAVKNILLDEIFKSQETTPDEALLINSLLYPTEVSMKGLDANFEYSFDGNKQKFSFLIDGIGFKPPTTKIFLDILNQTLVGVSLPQFTLTFEGASDENEFVEIEVSPSTSGPLSIDRRKVVWTVDNLTNINLVKFNIREWPKPSITLNQTAVTKGDTVKITGLLTIEGEPVTGQAVNIIANNVVIGTVKTDNIGGFSYTHKFENVGSYEIKTSLEYYEKTVESKTTVLAVNSPPLTPTVLTIQTSKQEVTEGDSIIVSGTMSPKISSAKITLTYTKPDTSTTNRTTYTDSNGSYTDNYTPSGVGSWSVKSSWDGDQSFKSSTSSKASFTVAKKAEQGGGGIPSYPTPSIFLALIVITLLLKKNKIILVK